MAKPVSIIVAALMPSMGIGYKNRLPWRLSQEMKYFKKITTQTPEEGQLNAVVMGRKTWDSFPARFRPLPGRHNVVVSRQVANNGEERDGATFYASVEDALAALSENPAIARVFVIGGAEIYNHCVRNGLVDQLFVTEIQHASEEPPMDTFLDAQYIGANFKHAPHAELEHAAGFAVAEGPQQENGFVYHYRLHKRV